MYLTFINSYGPNFKGEMIYEFIFTKTKSVWGDGWDAEPCNGQPEPPSIYEIKEVGKLETSEFKLELVRNSHNFCMEDAIDGIIALAWSDHEEGRLVFKYGEAFEVVESILNKKNYKLKF